MKSSLTRFAVLFFVASALLVTARGFAAEARKEFVTEAGLYDVVARELGARLARTERWTLLPNNLSTVATTPEREPVFVLGVAPLSGLTNLTVALETVAKDQGGFRLLRSGRIAGISKDELVIGGSNSNNWHGYAITGPAGTRHFRHWVTTDVRGTFRSPTGWGLRIGRGLKFDTGTNALPDIPHDGGGGPVIETKDETVFLTRTNFTPTLASVNALVILTRTATGMNQTLFTNTPVRDEQGAVRLADGQWLLIGRRLLKLQPEFPSAPPVADLEGLLKALDTGDRTNFFRLLERTSVYNGDHLKGLIQLLMSPSDEPDKLAYLDSTASSAVQQLQEFKAPEKLLPAERERLAKAIATYKAEAAKFLEELEGVRGSRLGVAPRRIGDALRSYHQYFDGWWIQEVRLLDQQGVESAVFAARYLDKSYARRYGIFRVDNAAHLTLLGDYEMPQSPGERNAAIKRSDYFTPGLRYFRTLAGEEMIFAPFEGLARLAGGKLEWVDQGDEFKAIHRFLGLDKQGRAYFASPAAFPALGEWPGEPKAEDGALWVYRFSAPAPTAAPCFLFPLTSMPQRDSRNRVWFLSQLQTNLADSRYLGWLAGSGPVRSAAEEIGKTPPPSIRVKEVTNARPDSSFARLADLYYFDDRTLTRAATNIPAHIALLAGRDGALIGAGRLATYSDGLFPPGGQLDAGAFVINGDTLLKTTGLHDLAQQDFGLLANLAPVLSQPARGLFPAFQMHAHSRPSLCLDGDTLWICQHNQLEAYREGKPLGIEKRLTVRNVSREPRILHGPLPRPGGTALVVVPLRGGQPETCWISRRGEEIALERDDPEKQAQAMRKFPGIMHYRGNVVNWNVVPTADIDGGRLYFDKTADEAWAISGATNITVVPQSGRPVLAARDGVLMHRSGPSAPSGYRFCDEENRRDVPPTYLENLAVIGATEKHELVCGSHQELVWVAAKERGQYVVTRRLGISLGVYPHAYIAETPGMVFFTVMDAGGNGYLAALRKE